MILTFDTETTGLDPKTDRIIEICLMVQELEGVEGQISTWRINPKMTIPEAAWKVHGISIDDLAEAPTFAELGEVLYTIVKDASVVVGYNVQFDIAMLTAEFERIGLTWDLSGVHVVDPMKLWKKMERRTLNEAHRRFVGGDVDGAHAAEVDVLVTAEVLKGMLKGFGLEDKTMAELAEICDPARKDWVGTTSHFLWNDKNEVCFGFGKHKDRPVAMEVSYLRWMATADFPRAVQEVIKNYFAGGLVRG